jgi:3-hydroxyacyl-CoA dehydrogenase
VENLDVKIPLYQKLGKITPPHAILGSNTSSLAINDFAKPSGRPEKVVRAH